MEEVEGWVEDPIHSRTLDNKYFRITETYWLMKTLITQALEKKNKEEKQGIFHTIIIFESKFEAMCKVVFGIKILVSMVAEDT
jgi:hypothetical protein